MLSRLGLQSSFRSLTPDTFGQDVKFGKRTVIYGHNGSGKSSLAELLYELSEGRCSETVSWFDASGSRMQLPPRTTPSQGVLSVYTKSWVHANLADFLDGDSAASIVTLGSAAVDAKKRQKELEESLEKLREDEVSARSKHESSRKAAKALVSSVQNSIEGTLREVDHREYTKHRYNDPRVREMLSEKAQDYADAETHRQNLEEVARDPLTDITLERPHLPMWEQVVEEVSSLLRKGVDSQLIAELLGNSELQTWLESGLSLHEHESSCLFCEGTLEAPWDGPIDVKSIPDRFLDR